MLTKIMTKKKAKKIPRNIEGGLVMACRTPPLKKAKKQGEMPLPILGPILSLYSTILEWDGTEGGLRR